MVPLIEILVILSAELAELVSVTDCGVLVTPRGWLANVRLVGERLTLEEDVPVPERVAGIGEMADEKVTFAVAVRLPEAVGVKLTLIAQEAPAAIVPQLFVWEKSAALVPEIVTVETRIEPWPTFDKVRVWLAEVV